MAHILVVDDESAIRDVEVRWLALAGHRVRSAASGEEALTLLKQEAVDLALLDVRMPGMGGLALAKTLKAQFPETAIVMATGVGDINAAVEAMHAGAVDYVQKPFQRQHLMDAIERGLASWQERRSAAQLESAVQVQTTALSAVLAKLETTSKTSVNALMSFVSLTDPEAAEHSRRVASLSVRLSRELGMSDEARLSLERAAMLHDIGKVAVSRVVLTKEGPLSPEEEQLVRRHPRVGFDIVREIPFLVAAADVILAHQEHFDGGGYPHGVSGEAIPFGARIVAVADAYDAMTHDRVYRPARSIAEAASEISRCSGKQFDPVVVDALLRILSPDRLRAGAAPKQPVPVPI